MRESVKTRLLRWGFNHLPVYRRTYTTVALPNGLRLAPLFLSGLLGIAAAQQIPEVLTIDRAASQVTIHVGKAGLFRFAGHAHEVIAQDVNGTVRLDRTNPARSSVQLEVVTTSLAVTGRGEPIEDVPEVQRVMLSEQVLDVEQFPTIVFASREIGVAHADAESLQLVIVGDLTLHGVTRPQNVRVTVELGQDGVTATGTLTIKQTDFGIEPVRAAAGMVKVKDELEITFSLRART